MTDTTTQPDPQVVAWMRGHLRKHPDARHGDLVHAYRRTHGVYQPPAWDALYAAEQAARKPLTVADIPAGQGTASLFLMRSEQWGGGFPVLFYRDEDGRPRPIYQPGVGGYPEGVEALWEHLAATLPTIDATEDAP